MSLLDAVVSFARDLRAAGMGVSVSEVADAVRAAGEVGAMGRDASGVQGMRLRKRDEVISCSTTFIFIVPGTCHHSK